MALPDKRHDHADCGHAGHSHGVSADADLLLGLMAVEVGVGVAANSLALLSDAAHMLTDAAALALALVAIRLARRPARGALTYGFRRVEILSAQANGVTLLVLALLIAYEGVHRLVDPPDVAGGAVLAVALLGVVVNLAATWTLSKANRQSMNIEGAFQHVLTDLVAFIATAVAGAVILATGFSRADGIASLVVAAIMLRAAWGLLKASGRVFLEAAPEGLDPDTVGTAMAAFPGILEVHDLHVWEVSSGFPALSAHVTVSRERNCHDARRELEHMLVERFAIDHTTLQVDHEGGDLLQVEMAPGASAS
jgi:cobalt-zinc-cadmium efflux system protein